ncbi:hypothetical protein U1Q18_003625 [Sarracenia purpurea var. burkii]
MTDEDIGERVRPVIAQNIKRDRSRDGPQLCRFRGNYVLRVLKVVDRKIIAVIGLQHRRRRVVELGVSDRRCIASTAVGGENQHLLYLQLHGSSPRR